MASPGGLKGQRKGSCGHITAVFNLHENCARCWEKKIGQDLCVLGNDCVICDGFSDSQKERLATPSYKIRKEKKAGLLVSPKDVTVISALDVDDQSIVHKGGESKPIKKVPKSSKSDKAKPDFGTQTTASAGPVLDIPSSGDEIQELVFQPMHASSTITADMGFQSTGPEKATGQQQTATGSSSLFNKSTKHNGRSASTWQEPLQLEGQGS